MALKEDRKCGRLAKIREISHASTTKKAAAAQAAAAANPGQQVPRIQGGYQKPNKYWILNTVMKEAFEELSFEFKKAKLTDVENAVGVAFLNHPNHGMQPFELDEEKKAMIWRIMRYCHYEQQCLDFNPICFAEKVDVSFAGETHSVRVDVLIRRKDHIEAVIYKYSAPTMRFEGRTLDTASKNDPDLLLLQLAGEELAKKYNQPQSFPVFGSYFHMKARNDTTASPLPEFNSSDEENIVSFCFLPQDKRKLEDEYKSLKKDLDEVSEDPGTCEKCPKHDLCYDEFVPHKKEEAEETTCANINELKFSPDQENFINSDGPNPDGTPTVQRCNAVPGSGKTTCTCAKIIAKMEEGVEPENLLVLSFGNSSAAEIRNRLRAFADGDALKAEHLPVDRVGVYTFNAFGQELLDKHYALVGFTNPPTLVDEVAKTDVLLQLLDTHRNLPLDYRNPFMVTRSVQGAVVALGKIVDALKANHVKTPDDVKKAIPRYATGTALAQEYLDIYNEYNRALIDLNMIDYEDQLRLLMSLKDHGVFEKMTYEYVIVDEFQDSNPNQIDIIVELVNRCKTIRNLSVVGDELQAIYGFRNATPDNIVNFGKYFPNVEDIPLEDNYRSETPIIAMANRMSSKTARIKRTIKCHKQEAGIPPVIREVDKEQDEADLFVAQAKKLIETDGVNPSDIAVICRTKKELIKFQKEFDKAGIPTILKVPKIVGEEPFVKAVISLAAYLRDQSSTLDFAYYAKSLGQDPFDLDALDTAADTMVAVINSAPNEYAKIALFFDAVKHCREDYVGDSFVTSLENKGFHTLAQMLDYCVKYRNYGIKETISTSRDDIDCVNLITAHSAKGLEWDNVFISLKAFKDDNEEERLLYVAITRARQRLLITYKKKQYFLASLLLP